MRNAIRRAMALAAVAAGAAWGESLTVTCTPATLPQTVGSTVSISCAVSGGISPYTWSISPSLSSLPPGLTLSPTTGSSTSVTGTLQDPAGTYNFMVVATDSTVPTPLTGSQSYSGTTVDPLTPTCVPTTGPVEVGVIYMDTCTATGGTPPYSWSIAPQGTPPPGLTISSTAGTITYTPSAPGAYQYKVMVTDVSSPALKQSVTFTGTIVPLVAIATTSPLPAADAGSQYSQQFAVMQGTGVAPFGWAVSPSTPLPTGLTLTAAGVLQGIPPSPGTVNFTAMVTDGAGGVSSGKFSFTVNQPLQINTSSPLAGGAVNAPYNQSLTGSGGVAPYTWALATGNTLPPGLSLSTVSSNGVISGTPSTAGPYTFTVQMTDSLSYSTSKQFAITISAGLSITSSTLPNATVSVAYNQSLAATGGVQPYTWSPVGTLPAPLAPLSLAANGAITGTPAATAPATGFQVTVTDQTGTSVSKTVMLSIVAAPSINTSSPLPGGTVGVSYSETLSASGGTSPFNWTVSSGTLPGGLTLGATSGAITGKPSTAGTSNFTVLLTDATGVTASKAFALTIVSGVSISTSSPLPTGEINLAYTETFTAAGGSGTYTWSKISGTLPPGLTLSPSGSLTGTPNTAGTYNFTVQAVDSNKSTASEPFALTIEGPVAISTPGNLSAGSLNSSYSENLQATAGLAPYSWMVTAGSLPTGLSLTTAGLLAGTPSVSGTFTFTATVTDSLGATASRQFTLVIAVGLTITSPATLPGGTVNVTYSYLFQASGGTLPYTWTTVSGTPPPGVSMHGNGSLSGEPTGAGTFNFTVQVTDGAGHQASAQASLTVAPALVITTTALAGGTVGGAYSQSLAATGGTPPYTWSLMSGSLPGGLSLSASGSITGTANAAGTFKFTVLLTDSTGATQTKQLTIVVATGLAITTAAALPNATLNASYSQTFAAAGGNAPYSWAETAGALPGGLTLSTTGAITGSPNATGTFQFTVTVTDSASATASLQFTLIVVSGLTITTTSLPNGKLGTSYSQALTASGGSPPYTFAVSVGSLPPGITLSANVISGTPNTLGSYTFTIQVTDSASTKATQQFTITIAGLVITTTTLPAAAVGTAYSQTLSAQGTAPYTWVVTQGTLPTGLSLDASSGTISGTPGGAGASSITVQVTDSTSATASQALTLTVISASYTGLAATASSGQQVSFSLALGAAYPQAITGQVTVAFQPDTSLASPANDPAIQFSSGGTSASFTIPANSMAPISFSLQSGTVAGTISFTVTWQAGGAGLAVPATLTQSITIAPATPVISAVTASTNSSGFSVVIIGYSNTRDLSQAVLQFTPASGQTLQTTSLTVSLSSVATAWFGGSASDQYGGQFVLTLPFTVTNGSASAIASVSVQLVNSAGTSSSSSATF